VNPAEAVKEAVKAYAEEMNRLNHDNKSFSIDLIAALATFCLKGFRCRPGPMMGQRSLEGA
jgi:hypothetical protein